MSGDTSLEKKMASTKMLVSFMKGVFCLLSRSSSLHFVPSFHLYIFLPTVVVFFFSSSNTSSFFFFIYRGLADATLAPNTVKTLQMRFKAFRFYFSIRVWVWPSDEFVFDYKLQLYRLFFVYLFKIYEHLYF